jgi:two-component system cell cycle sensor histidine kinase/response regulator CckA
MSEIEARLPRDAGPVENLAGGAGVAAIVAAMLAAGAVVFALVLRSSPESLLLTLLCTLAMLGLFAALGFASGQVRVGDRVQEDDLVHAVAGGFPHAVAVATSDGRVVYANAAALALASSAAGARNGCIDDLFGELRQNADAWFRLSRAAECGRRASEELTLAGSGGQRHFAVSVAPFALPRRSRLPAQLQMWTIVDTTDERIAAERKRAGLQAAVAHYDRGPVALASLDETGVVRQMNATFVQWLGLPPATLATAPVKLSDFASPDVQVLIESAVARSAEHPVSIDLDLTRHDGRLLPARVVCQRANGDGTGFDLAAMSREFDADLPGAASEGPRFQRFFHSAPFGIATVGPDGRIVAANSAFSRMVLEGNAARAELVATILCRSVAPETRAVVEAGLNHVLSGRGMVAPVDITVGDKSEFVRRVYMSPMIGAGSDREAAVLYVIDATEQKALEAKLVQSQKMEAVGQLAGGIAHDFRNMLTVIIGCADLLMQTVRPKDPGYQDLQNIKTSANRAANLVGKLMAFSRQETLQREVLDLGEVLTELAPLLKRAAGEKVELRMPAGRDLWYVMADRVQFEQVIMNLANNARDAMPDGGSITLRTYNVSERDSQKLGHHGMSVGEYVAIEVEDTGTGMPPEVLAKVFEPFFTTKKVGQGTGLGLAMVYGNIRQSGGFIYPESTVGKGTVFRIYLPRYHAEDLPQQPAPKPAAPVEDPAADVTGSGRVLLVEDEDMVRGFAVRALKSRGFEVLEAASGVEALEVLATQTRPVDIIVSDVVMPEMDGPTLLKEVRKSQPDLKFIFVSGHPNDAFRDSVGEQQFSFLPKPYSLPKLVAKVKEEIALTR